MPHKITYEKVAPEVFMVVGDVPVYHTYANDDVANGPSMTWFTLSPEDMGESRYDFSPTNQGWDLPDPLLYENNHPGHLDACYGASERKARESAWKKWNKSGEPEWKRSAVSWAVKNGFVTPEAGYVGPYAVTPVVLASGAGEPGDDGLRSICCQAILSAAKRPGGTLVFRRKSTYVSNIPSVARMVAWSIRGFSFFGSRFAGLVETRILDHLSNQGAEGDLCLVASMAAADLVKTLAPVAEAWKKDC